MVISKLVSVLLLAMSAIFMVFSACADGLNVPVTVNGIDDMPDYPGEIACDISVKDGHLLFVFDEPVDSSWILNVRNEGDQSYQWYEYSAEEGGFLSERNNYTASDVDFDGTYYLERCRTKEGAGLDEMHTVGYNYMVRLTDEEGFWWEWTCGVPTGYGYRGILSCYYTAGTLTKYIRWNLDDDGSLGNISVTYDPQGQIIEAEVDLDEGEYTYTKSYGWRCDYASSNAPEGYDISDLKELLPPLVYVEVITLPSKLTATVGEMGINTDRMLNDVPDCPAVYVENGVLCIEAQRYESLSLYSWSADWYLDGFEWKDDRWESTATNVTEAVLQDYDLYVTGNSMRRTYSTGSLSHCTWNVINGSISWSSGGSVHVNFDSIGASATYGASGRLSEYSYLVNTKEAVEISYAADGTFGGVIGPDGLSWDELDGWNCYDYESGMDISCDAPAGLESYTTVAEWIAAFPPLVVVKIDKEVAAFPVKLDTVPVTPPVSIEAVLAQPDELTAWLPARIELGMTVGGVRFSDAGYAKANVLYYGTYAYYDLVWDGEGWLLEDAALTPDGLQAGQYDFYGYGENWNCNYFNGELYSISGNVTEQDSIYYAPDASVMFSLTKANSYTAEYDSEGQLQEYQVSFPGEIRNVYRPDGSVRQLRLEGYLFYSPQQGWYYISYEYVENRYVEVIVPCDPPAGYEDYDEALIQKLYPPLIGSYRALPSFYDASLPGSLLHIEARAFAGTTFRRVYIPEGAQSIGAAAFENCAELDFIRIPASVTEIAADAFSGCDDVTVVTPSGSVAEGFARSHGLMCINE